MGDLLHINLCPPPFYDSRNFTLDGFVDGRLCQSVGPGIKCCLPCPMTDWIYPDSFNTITQVADWAAAVGVVCIVFLLLSWAFLPVEKTNRHYLSICLTIGVLLMNLGFVVPLAAKPNQCFDQITPNSMHTSKVCGASGSLLILGGWAGVMWAFLRSLSLHLQICWQVLVGRSFMIFAQAAGWGVPLIGITLALVFSGVSFRFGPTCHINHENSLATLWIPLLIFAGITVICTFATFGYCVKVYLASLVDSAESTEGSSIPYTSSVRTMSPRQAYRRVRRVIALQWRGIAIVLIIAIDVIFFSIIFVFQDNVIQQVTNDPRKAQDWIACLLVNSGDKNACFGQASKLVVNEPTVAAVLLLLAVNGFWLLFLLGRWSMVTGWIDLFSSLFGRSRKAEFVSVDARFDAKPHMRSYEMISRETSAAVTPVAPAQRKPDRLSTPDFFNQPPRNADNGRSNLSPRATQRPWDGPAKFATSPQPYDAARRQQSSPNQWVQDQQQWQGHHEKSLQQRERESESSDGVNPLGMNRF